MGCRCRRITMDGKYGENILYEIIKCRENFIKECSYFPTTFYTQGYKINTSNFEKLSKDIE